LVGSLLSGLSFVASTHRKYMVLIYSAAIMGVLVTALVTL
jgi:hypothetical protein